jgi:vitamin B12 transporter
MIQFSVSSRGALPCAAIAFLCTVHSGLAVAQTSIPPVIVTASRAEQALTDLLADVTVIGAEEIARAGAGGLAALLQRQPVSDRRQWRVGSTSGAVPQRTRKTLVLIVDCASARRPAAPRRWKRSPENRRIEILRGPASSLGADALGASSRCSAGRRVDGEWRRARPHNTAASSVASQKEERRMAYRLQAGHRQATASTRFNPENSATPRPRRLPERQQTVAWPLALRRAGTPKGVRNRLNPVRRWSGLR